MINQRQQVDQNNIPYGGHTMAAVDDNHKSVCCLTIQAIPHYGKANNLFIHEGGNLLPMLDLNLCS
jgi:hypothetical protein